MDALSDIAPRLFILLLGGILGCLGGYWLATSVFVQKLEGIVFLLNRHEPPSWKKPEQTPIDLQEWPVTEGPQVQRSAGVEL